MFITLDFAFYIGSTPTFYILITFFDLYLKYYTYAVHALYVYSAYNIGFIKSFSFRASHLKSCIRVVVRLTKRFFS